MSEGIKGWKLVPIVLPDYMEKAFKLAYNNSKQGWNAIRDGYAAMLSAAPEPSASVGMEPAKPIMYFCNKCGHYGTDGPIHRVHSIGVECGYHAAADGPWYSADQLATLQAKLEQTEEAFELVKKLHINAICRVSEMQAKLEQAEKDKSELLSFAERICDPQSAWSLLDLKELIANVKVRG